MENIKHRAPHRFWQRCRLLPRNVLAISLVSLLNDASSEIIYPFLPLYLVTLGASTAVIGLIEGAAESISSFLKLFSGYWSDRRGGRKGLVVFGYALAGLSRPFLVFTTSWFHVLAIRLTDRVGKGIRSAPRDAIIADSAAEEMRGLAFGFHRAMDHLGAIIGPGIGFLVLYWIATNPNAPTASDYRKVFLFASIPALAAVIVAWVFVRETARRRTEDVSFPTRRLNWWENWRGLDKNFKRFLVIVLLFTLSNSSDTFLLLRARSIGISAAAIPLLWVALHVAKVFSSLVGGDLSDRVGREKLIVAGWLVYAAVYAGFAFVSSTGMVWMLFLIYGVYFGLAEGAEKALVADLVPAHQRGTGYGLYNLAFSIAVFPASLLMGALWDWRGAETAFLASACISTISALLFLIFVRTRSGREESRAL